MSELKYDCTLAVSKGTVAPEGWLHMDVVEKEKLEWTSEAPVDTATSQRVCVLGGEGEEGDKPLCC